MKGIIVKSEHSEIQTVSRADRGFTLLELMVVMAIMAALLAWALPNLNQSIQNNRTASQNMMMLAMLNFTKSEAVRRSTTVDMVLTLEDGAWSAIVEDPTNEADVQGCVPGQLRCTSSTGATLVVASQEAEEASEAGFPGDAVGIEPNPIEIDPNPIEINPQPTAQTFEISYNNRGYIRGSDDAWAPETFFLQHEDCAGLNQRYRIDITPTGQVSSCTLACDSTEACQ
ncbi:MAG TPA: prepilin-type N-terminal cleavage/methylation domain-containing protein [Xanthomonadales bacterium]|nr:prepilin-type N-terminal cleavage/methylation domain-containing protein [Xanthomonadales bacterium]